MTDTMRDTSPDSQPPDLPSAVPGDLAGSGPQAHATDRQAATATVSTEGAAAGGTMRAIVQASYGDADVLQLERIPRPEIATTRSFSVCVRRGSTAARGI